MERGYWVTIEPRERFSWLPASWRPRVLSEPDGHLNLTMVDVSGQAGPIQAEKHVSDGRHFWQASYRPYKKSYVYYSRNRQPEFESSYRRICGSFKVVEDK